MKQLTSTRRIKAFSLVLILLGIVGMAFAWDQAIDDFVRARPDSPWKPLAWFMTRYADWPFLILYALVFFIVGVRWKNGRWKTLAIAMALTCFITGVTATTIRSVTGRTRPNATAAKQGWYGLRHDSQWTIGNSQFNSFPSGHVGAGMGFVMPLILGTRRGRWVGVIFIVLLAWARIFAGYHHLSDVVVASIIGVFGGYLVWLRLVPTIAASSFCTEVSVER